MRYGALEHAFAEPIAEALISDPAFRVWLLSHTRFAIDSKDARLLHDEMRAARSAGTWWRSHYTESCRCEGCRGQETDLFAIFERPDGSRFALHVEVKQPTDRFPGNKDQAANYRIRAECWVRNPPKSVLPHGDADTLLLCSEMRLQNYAPHLAKFGAVITFEEVRRRFPRATVP